MDRESPPSAFEDTVPHSPRNRDGALGFGRALAAIKSDIVVFQKTFVGRGEYIIDRKFLFPVKNFENIRRKGIVHNDDLTFLQKIGVGDCARKEIVLPRRALFAEIAHVFYVFSAIIGRNADFCRRFIQRPIFGADRGSAVFYAVKFALHRNCDRTGIAVHFGHLDLFRFGNKIGYGDPEQNRHQPDNEQDFHKRVAPSVFYSVFKFFQELHLKPPRPFAALNVLCAPVLAVPISISALYYLSATKYILSQFMRKVKTLRVFFWTEFVKSI